MSISIYLYKSIKNELDEHQMKIILLVLIDSELFRLKLNLHELTWTSFDSLTHTCLGNLFDLKFSV